MVKHIILDFETNKVPSIISILSKYQFTRLINIIERKSNIIKNNINIVEFNNFDYAIHLNSLFNFIVDYETIYGTCINNETFFKIIENDFNIYWLNIKNLDNFN